MEKIVFKATVNQVRTLADGGLRFILDAPETEVMQAAQLMECKRFGVVLRVECVPVELSHEEVKEEDAPTPAISRRPAKRRKQQGDTGL